MSAKRSPPHRLLAGFAAALAPVEQAASSTQAMAGFLGGFGWTLPASDSGRVSTSLAGVSLPADPSSLTTDQLVTGIVSAVDAVRSIAGSGAPAAFASTFPAELLDFLVHRRWLRTARRSSRCCMRRALFTGSASAGGQRHRSGRPHCP